MHRKGCGDKIILQRTQREWIIKSAKTILYRKGPKGNAKQRVR